MNAKRKHKEHSAKKRETLLGTEIKEDFSMKMCCNLCGFPVGLPRKPVLLDDNLLSMLEYDHNVCTSCGHQKDGTTIPVVYRHWQDLCNHFIKEREDLIKFLKHYSALTDEERKGVCMTLPKFMNPNYKSKGDMEEDDIPVPYSWNVVYNEVINATKLYRVMVRDIDWEQVKP